MAIKHTIRTRDMKVREVSLTPLSAIRHNCLECVCWSPNEVKNCNCKLCPLYPFRLRKDPSRKGIKGKNK